MAGGMNSAMKVTNGHENGPEPLASGEGAPAELAILRQAHWAAAGQLTPGLIHEVNNVLCVVSNYAQLLLLKTEGEGSDIVKSLQAIGDYTDRAQAILHRFAEYARSPDRSSTSFRITDLLEKALALAHLQRPFRTIHLRRKFAEDLPQIEGNPHLVMDVLFELLQIAASVIPAGETLTVHTQPIFSGSTRLPAGDSAGPLARGAVIGFTGAGQWPQASSSELAVARTLIKQLRGRLMCECDRDATSPVPIVGIWLTLPDPALSDELSAISSMSDQLSAKC